MLLERLSDLPVTVIEDWPVAVERLAVRVNVLVELVGLVLNDAVTPLGNPLALRVTCWLKPPAGTIVIVLVPVPPCATVTVLGEAVRVKLPNAVTFKVSVVVTLRLPVVPVIVTVVVPFFAVALAVRVSVLLVVAGFGLNAAVTPLGKPDADRLTFPLKPFEGAMVIVLVA